MDELLGLGYNYHAEEDSRIESVTLDKAREVAAGYFGTDHFATSVSLPAK
jgi:hypothetical protein